MKILCITPIDHIPGIKKLLSSLGELTIFPDPTFQDISNMKKDFNIICFGSSEFNKEEM